MKKNNFIFYIINTLVALIFVLPLVWMVVSAFKEETKIFEQLTSYKALLPNNLTLDNFRKVFQRIPMGRYILNSLTYVSILSFCGAIVNAFCGYALAKFKFRGNSAILITVIALTIVPFESIMLPLYMIVFRMKMINTMPALIVPFIGNCFSIYMFRQFFIDFPDSLLEAAYIDGASRFKTFITIVIPNSIPVFTTVFILDFVSHWGDFLWPILVTTNDKIKNVQLGIQSFFTMPPIYYGQIMAALVLATLPMVIVFLFFQKYYIQGIASTGMKD